MLLDMRLAVGTCRRAEAEVENGLDLPVHRGGRIPYDDHLEFIRKHLRLGLLLGLEIVCLPDRDGDACVWTVLFTARGVFFEFHGHG